MLGQGCSKCNKPEKLTLEIFLKRAYVIHQNLYDYSKVLYFKNIEDKIEIICKKHGSFLQGVQKHLKGQGCPDCKKSKGEIIIRNYLNEN
ncbi:MAG: hypothetical protein RLZZ546_2305 [Bacteroidota bacterium]|jgi:hypothetical protein